MSNQFFPPHEGGVIGIEICRGVYKRITQTTISYNDFDLNP